MANKLTAQSTAVRKLIKLRELGWDAIIAGGAVRDTFHGKPISDIDIFTTLSSTVKKPGYFKDQKWLEYWVNFFGKTGLHSVRFLGNEYTFGSLDKHLLAVWEIKFEKTKYQIILLDKDPIKYMTDNFDFGLCRAYCSGTKMHFTDAFIKDSMNQTITLYPEHLTDEQIEYATGRHLKKLIAKYPGFTPHCISPVDTNKK